MVWKIRCGIKSFRTLEGIKIYFNTKESYFTYMQLLLSLLSLAVTVVLQFVWKYFVVAFVGMADIYLM